MSGNARTAKAPGRLTALAAAARQNLHAVFNSYSEVLFLQGWPAGLALFAATLLNPNVAAAGLISILSAYLFARQLEMDRSFLSSGFYTYNPLLAGLAIGYLFKLTPLTVLFLVSAGIFTFVLTILMNNLFSMWLKLPILSLPFVIISSIAYLASSKYSGLFVNGMYPHGEAALARHLPEWASGFLTSLGAIFFLPTAEAGLVIALVILLTSRILFLLAVLGYLCGTSVTALLTGSFHEAFSDVNHFNSILIAMALGGVFLIPSRRSCVMAMIAVTASTMFLGSVQVFWSSWGIPGFTLPFNFVCLSFIYVLGLVNYPLVAKNIRSTPEETLDEYLSNFCRYGGTERTLWLPFPGRWTVWQGVDGQWTHQGGYRYAFDFVITDDDGRTFRDTGMNATDYYAFRKPVLSPLRGRVLKVIDSLPDNQVGQVDKSNPWGNLIVLQDERGFFVALAHLAQDSVNVREGDWVERGTLLASCGNSGYSPQPHIHVQAQATGEIGSTSLPCSFVSFMRENLYYANAIPGEGDAVEPLFCDKTLEMKTSFMLDDRFSFEITRGGRSIGRLSLVVKSTPDGAFYFDSGKGRLYFGRHEGTFYTWRVEGRDPHLRNFFLALPRLPLAYREGLEWHDSLPLGVVAKGAKKALVQFASAFAHRLAKVRAVLRSRGRSEIAGSVHAGALGIHRQTAVELDDYVGFKRLQVDDTQYRRVEDEPVRS